VFYIFLALADNLAAREDLELAQATALGKALAENGKDGKTKRARRRYTRRAYPEVGF